MTACAVGGGRERAVIDLGATPGRGLVARTAVGGGGNVRAVLARCGGAIVAVGAIGRSSKDCMVDLGPRP